MKAIFSIGSLIMAMLFPPRTVMVSIIPSRIYQGDPVMIIVSGTTTAAIQKGTLSGTDLHFFGYEGKSAALYGVGINQRTGTTTAVVSFADGSQASTTFFIIPRPRVAESLAIPAQLGGNSLANQAAFMTMLKTDNASLAAIHSEDSAILWTATDTSAFVLPVASSTGSPAVVTDPYGYERDSGADLIIHKGVDFRAPPGTPIYAINSGIVRMAKDYTVYGNSIIIDHGLGLLSMYMHLSKMAVTPGQSVEKGQIIGYSGETGYAEGPHLHLTVRIGGVSIDPMRFFALFGVK